MSTATGFNQRTIDEFHSNAGRGVGGWGDLLLLMTSIGARTGREITTPLVHRRLGDEWVVVASKGGAPEHPQWLSNIRANPAVTIEVARQSGTEHIPVIARVVTDPTERDRLYAYMTEVWPSFAKYAANTARTIPVVILVRA